MFKKSVTFFMIFTMVLMLGGLTQSFAFKAPDENSSNNHEKVGFNENDTAQLSASPELTTVSISPNLKLNLTVHGDIAGAAIDAVANLMRATGSEAVVERVYSDQLTFRHIRLAQQYKGLPVVGSGIVVHINSKNVIYQISGKYLPEINVSIKPKIDADAALQIGLDEQQNKEGLHVSKQPSLVIYGSHLAYYYVISHDGTDVGQWWYYVDAHTGKLISRYNNIQYDDYTTTYTDSVKTGTVTVDDVPSTDSQGITVKVAPVPGNGFHTTVLGIRLIGEDGSGVSMTGWKENVSNYYQYNFNNLWGIYDEDVFDWEQNATNDWWTLDPAAVSAGKNFELTQDWVMNVLGRNSFNNAGAFARGNVHTGTNYVNAYWNGVDFHFGDGNGIRANALTVLDVVAHEYGHAVTQYTSNLIYRFESGALNESFSDIMGVVVEFASQPDGTGVYPNAVPGNSDWLMGEDCWLPNPGDALRNMRSPHQSSPPQPSYYKGTYWYSGWGDNGGVHYNSGVQNFAFYLLAEGGSGINDGHPYGPITGIGVIAAAEVAMRANTVYLTPSSQYVDSRVAWISAAADLGYPVATVEQVWDAVGVVPPCTDAPIANFTGLPTSGDVPLVVSFTDQSTNTPTSWSWDFGDGGTSASQNPVHTYATGGTYSVSLTATNACGSNQVVKTGYITVNQPLTANFSGTPTVGCAPLTVNFTDMSLGTATSWLWDFGDGGTSTAQNPNHIYANGGTYTVTLTVTNANESDQMVKMNYITVDAECVPPVADFSGTPTTGCKPLTVYFSDLSTGTIDTWSWDFGDGGTSTLQNPVHNYFTTGIYTVSLTVQSYTGVDIQTKTNYISVDAQPVVNFTANQTSGGVPLTVNFTDLSTGNPTSWSWNFGDDGTSTLQNPTHTYTQPGMYAVTLTASNSCGVGNQLIKEDFILACPSPVVSDFTGSPTIGNAPLQVTFTEATNNATIFDWDFGDGSTLSTLLPTVSHTYDTAGTYTVTLTASNDCGESNQMVKTNFVTVLPPCNNPPTADFVGLPTSGSVPLTVSFTDQSLNNPTGWSWDFGDAGTSALQNPSHTYNAVGSYTVTLTATNSCGSDQVIMTNYVTVTNPPCNNPPVAAFIGVPTSGGVPLTVSFTDESLNAPTGWSWDFGDGGTSTLQNPSHTYNTEGLYAVTLTATNSCGSDQVVQTDYVNVQPSCSNPPVANFTGNPLSGYPPLTVNFTDQSTNNPVSWSWDFGDFGASTEQNPTVVYDKPGNFKVILTVANGCGSDTLVREEYISVLEGNCNSPVAGFSGTPTVGDAPLTVNFTDQSTNAPDSWSWDFGDGNTSTQQNPSHTYTTAGTYTVSLTATNACGLDQAVQVGYITVNQPNCNPPVAGFAGTPTAGDAPLTVNFTDQSTNAPDSWSWDFGDGNTSTQQNPSHTYTTAGTYTVSLTATNACGLDQAVQVGYITVNQPTCNPPVAGFVGAPTTGDAPLSVSFTDQSLNTPTGWSWDFGDGNTSTQQNPNHTYSAAGIYTVSLTATNACGLDQAVQVGYIIVNQPTCTDPPVANFTANPISGYPPLTVSFTDQSTNNPDSWSWEFGDFGTSTEQNPTVVYDKPGNFKVILTVANGCGSDVLVREEYISVFEQQGFDGCQCPPDSTTGCISGYVTDLTGQPLADKIVRLKRVRPKTSRVNDKVVTDAAGCYRFSNLKNGKYKIWVKGCKDGGRQTVKIRRKEKVVNNVNFLCR